MFFSPFQINKNIARLDKLSKLFEMYVKIKTIVISVNNKPVGACMYSKSRYSWKQRVELQNYSSILSHP